jgi:predicted RND superfamily exporter protein
MLLSDGRNLIKFADTIKDIRLDDGRVFHSAGASLIFSDLVTAIRDEAPVLTLASFICVLIFVALVVRRWRASWVIVISLVFGITAMLGLVSFLKIKFNFFNFIALPLTFGIGVDYAINVVLRLVREDVPGMEHALKNTGLAVILCSLTTIIGYSVLIVANNQALASFGWIAIIGEVTCIGAAILLAPALLMLFRKNK